MDLYSYLTEIIITLFKHGWNVTTWGIGIALLFRINGVRKMLLRRIPKRFRHEDRLDRIARQQDITDRKVDAIMAQLGVQAWQEVGASKILTNGPTSLKRSSRLSQVVKSINLRRNESMKKWFRPDVLTVIAAALTAAFSRYFGFEIDPANIVAGAIMLISYFKAHEYVTIVRDANGLPTGFKMNSRKFIFTLVAFGLLVADQLLNLNVGNELIFSITAAVTGYNIVEGNKDAKAAESTLTPGEKNYH